jgi:hypothetical protein
MGSGTVGLSDYYRAAKQDLHQPKRWLAKAADSPGKRHKYRCGKIPAAFHNDNKPEP